MTFQQSTPYAPAAATATSTRAERRRRNRTWSTMTGAHRADLIASIVLILPLAAATMLLTFFSLFLAMASDACGSSLGNECDSNLFTVGWLSAVVVPTIVTILTVIVTIVLRVLGIIAFWVPLAGGALLAVLWIGAVYLISVSVNEPFRF